MAGVTATGLPQRTWFIAQAASITLKLDKKNWEDIQAFLKQFWWLPKLQERPCKGLWEDIVNLHEVWSTLKWDRSRLGCTYGQLGYVL